MEEHIYYQYDIDMAFDMGLETGIVILEQTVGLSEPAREEVIKKLKVKLTTTPRRGGLMGTLKGSIYCHSFNCSIF